MTVLTVTGGKGGTGKTVVAVNLALALSSLTGERVLLVDLDVDNPCTYTLLNVEPKTVEAVKSFKPVIDDDSCVKCGTCVKHCPAHALFLIPNKDLLFLETLCEGCAMCMYVCPKGAISRGYRLTGWVKEVDAGELHLVLGELRPGDRKYHDVMEATLSYAERIWRDYRLIVIDTPPGTGKGILMALNSSDIIVAVTEPTGLALLDLKRLNRLVKPLGKPEIVVVNKYGLPGGVHKELERYLKGCGLRWAKIRYDKRLMSAYIQGKLVIRCDSDAPSALDIEALAEMLAKEMSLLKLS